jgi:hypothetical protein
MSTGIQFTGTVAPNDTHSWFTWGWNPALHIVWYIMPTTPRPGAAELEWSVRLERSNPTQVTYWITVHNLTNVAVAFEGRYAIL